MFKVFIRHFMSPPGYFNDGQTATLVEEEALMYEIPSVNPDEVALIDPIVKNEMGKAGSFEFGMEQNNPWYSSLLQMTTLIRVKYDDETIFYGRVLTIDTDMYGKRNIHCEGALAFLLDSLMEATKEDDRKKITLEKYISDLIESHNRLMANDTNKKFVKGQVPGNYTQDIASVMKPTGYSSQKFGTGSWTSVLNCLEDLTSKYGGYWRARYNDSNGKLYLDWFRNFFDVAVVDQPFEVTENIIDISSSIDVNGIFTVLIPEGTKNGEALYLDNVPKTVKKVPIAPKKKDPIGPGLGDWVDGQGVSGGGTSYNETQ